MSYAKQKRLRMRLTMGARIWQAATRGVVVMLPRDQLADELAFKRAVALVEAHGKRVVDAGVGGEGSAERKE